MTVCPVCAVGFSRHYALIDSLNFFQCDSCQSVYLDPAILASIDCGMDPTSFDEGCQKRERDKARLQVTGESLTRVGEAILYARRPVRRFLDVGAGRGDLLDELASLFPGDKDLFHGIESCQPSRHSDHRNFKIGSVASLEGTFDAGVCIEVLGYLTPKNLQSLISDLSRVSEIDSLWLFQTGEPNFGVGNKKPRDLSSLSSTHIVSYSLKGLSPIFERSGFKIQEYPGKSWAFIAEFRPSAEILFEARFSHPLEFNKRLLMKSSLLWQASFESARSSFYFYGYREKEERAQLMEKELRESRSAHFQIESRFKREMKEQNTQIQSLKKDLEAITTSKSWVMTQHLRKIAGRIPPSIRREGWKIGRTIFRSLRRGWHLVRRVFHLRDSLNRLGHSLLRFLVSGNRKKYFSTLYRRLESMPILGSVLRKVYAFYKTQDGNYQAWIESYDTLTDTDRETFRKVMEGFASKPLISVIMPVYNTPEEFLVEAIESVLSQIYPHWELCISDNASSLPAVRKILEEYRQRDKRIRVVFRDYNEGISVNSNSALSLATGNFIALLDSDDLLSEDALFWVASEINLNPEVEIIYSDEDKLIRDGNQWKRCDFLFKPDFSLHFILTHNMNCLNHLGVYKHILVNDIGGFKKEFDGVQDLEIALRMIERTSPKQIRHIPRILYHWRVSPTSTAFSHEVKPNIIPLCREAIQSYLDRSFPGTKVLPSPIHPGFRKIKYQLPTPSPLVSILLPSGGGYEILKKCLDSIHLKTSYKNYEILIDNGCEDDIVIKFLEDVEINYNIRIIRKRRPKNYQFNYSEIINLLAKEAKGEVLVLLNDDVEVINNDWLSELVSFAIRPEIGCVGAKLYYPDDKIQHGGVIMGINGCCDHAFARTSRNSSGYHGYLFTTREVSAVTGAVLAVKTDLFWKVGGLNEKDLKVAFNDVDLCLSIYNEGYLNIWNPFVELYHHESFTRGFESDGPGERNFTKDKWKNIIMNDPYYNPNLSLEDKVKSYYLAFPPRVSKIPEIKGYS